MRITIVYLYKNYETYKQKALNNVPKIKEKFHTNVFLKNFIETVEKIEKKVKRPDTVKIDAPYFDQEEASIF